MNYLEGLNQRQKEAVTAPVGPVAVLAGAGSGKTRVLTHRILHVIHEGAAPQEILAVTFTNKAAKEMGERVNTLLESIPGHSTSDASPVITTFHSLGVRLLREFYKEAGLKKFFAIHDRADSMKIIKTIVKDMGLDEKHTEPKTILSKISKLKGERKTYEDILQSRSSSFFLRTTGEVWFRYERELKRQGALDFDDLLLKPLTLLEQNEQVRSTLQQRFKHILIDEYQDTNGVQSTLANILAAKHRSIFVVGDIDQNIYSWRGATIEHLLSFEETYPDAKTIILEQNYRSTKTIVSAAQAVIEKNVRRKDKYAFTENEDGNPLTLLVCSSEGDEARTVASLCQSHIVEGGDPGDIAVLYRTNFQSRVLEEAMLAQGVPYQVLGTKFFDRKEVKDLLSYVRLALMPESSVDLARVINTPARGIGKVTQLAVLQNKIEELGPSPKRKVENFFAMMEHIRQKVASDTPSNVLRFVIDITGLGKEYEKGGEDAQERLENIKELVTLSTRFDHEGGEAGLLRLLEEAALISDQDTMKEASAGVKLMTIHAAKGLEFGTVFITGLEEGLFPHERDEQDDDEEERRLFYVALTRAHKDVYLSMARVRRIYGTEYQTEPSSFISDIPHSHVHIEDGDQYGEPVII